LDVVSNEPDEVTVRQTVEQSAKFIHESGKDVTEESGHQRLVIDWYLERVDSSWLIAESLIIEAHDLHDE
jgi:hypothetical protein